MDSVRLLTVVYFLVFAANGATVPMVSLYLEALGASYARISVILTTYAITLIGANYLWGWLSDRLGRRKPMVVGGLVGMTVAFVLLAVAPSYRFAWGVRVLEGLASAAYMTTSLALMGDLLANNTARGQRIGSYRGFASLSFALGAFGAGPIIDHLGLRQVFVLAAGLVFLAMLFALLISEASPTGATPVQSASTELPADHQFPIVFLVGVILWSGAFWAAFSMWPNYLISLGYPKSASNWLGGLSAISEVPFMSTAGLLADKFGRAPVLVSGGIGMGLVLMGYILFDRWLTGLVGLQILRGFPFSTFTATSMIYAAEVGPARTRGRTVGVYRLALTLGQLLGLAAGGQIAQYAGFQALFIISTGVFLCSGLMFWLLHWRQPAAHPLQT